MNPNSAMGLTTNLHLPALMDLGNAVGSLVKRFQIRGHPERSGGGKTGAVQSKDPVDLRMIFREICAPNVSPTGFFGCLGSLRMTPFFF